MPREIVCRANSEGGFASNHQVTETTLGTMTHHHEGKWVTEGVGKRVGRIEEAGGAGPGRGGRPHAGAAEVRTANCRQNGWSSSMRRAASIYRGHRLPAETLRDRSTTRLRKTIADSFLKTPRFVRNPACIFLLYSQTGGCGRRSGVRRSSILKCAKIRRTAIIRQTNIYSSVNYRARCGKP